MGSARIFHIVFDINNSMVHMLNTIIAANLRCKWKFFAALFNFILPTFIFPLHLKDTFVNELFEIIAGP